MADNEILYARLANNTKLQVLDVVEGVNNYGNYMERVLNIEIDDTVTTTPKDLSELEALFSNVGNLVAVQVVREGQVPDGIGGTILGDVVVSTFTSYRELKSIYRQTRSQRTTIALNKTN